ncbi:hypothetical protein SAMN04487995_4857 [Dyadobacter koreensis]|uniref:PD-(D/E)XK nuclease superfamily protein n=1 Tax=Dyadobacter koreensis TaxID=408657 RepID=A0A1H6ZED6_9BACT|nr:hypothetical protein [Dyadobacter koreensis]SEJ47225.1 hypothetical protein SAMN04487995_4857 [Dyadobacter koreensis]
MEEINKRSIFQQYLINRLGFLDDDFLLMYMTFRLFHSKSGYIIDSLLYEYNLKRSLEVELKPFATKYISATDLSNFTYCKASFAISKTYYLPKNESAIKGTEQHEISPIISTFKYSNTKSGELNERSILDQFIKQQNMFFFEDLKKSAMVFSGHYKDGKGEEKIYFKSSKGNYVGQPDYIFLSENDKYFVVEEKFQYQCDDDEDDPTSFHLNHINQTVSYLHGISDFDIQYGYLVYWKYNFYGDGSINIHACYVKKIIKSSVTRSHITSVFEELRKFLISGITDFDVSKRNANKCANCVVSAYCGHKTGNFDNLEVPYSKKFWKLKYIPFPKELRPPEIGTKSG